MDLILTELTGNSFLTIGNLHLQAHFQAGRCSSADKQAIKKVLPSKLYRFLTLYNLIMEDFHQDGCEDI